MSARNAKPNVFLMGDSITAGYYEWAQADLAGQTEVRLRPENGRDSRHMLNLAAGWLEQGNFDLVHFNCGLHDIKRSHAMGEVQVPIGEYEANLYRIVELLRQFAPVLIWARTTPVIDSQQPSPGKSFDRLNRDVDAYNRVADRVMKACGITINDLHSAVVQAGSARCLSEDGVHMTEVGNRVLGQHVARAILLGLENINVDRPAK
jgi:lysophospholipase L1-like esterase